MHRWFRVAAGWVLVITGLIGLVLPVLQGVLFLALGGIILSRESPWARLQMRGLRHRYPRMAVKISAAEREARRLFERYLGRKT